MNDQTAQNGYLDDRAILPAVLRSYIPKQLLRHVDMKKVSGKSSLQYVQSVLSNSNGYMSVYEPTEMKKPAESLLKNMQKYMNFPLRRKMFPLQMGHYKNTIPEPYWNLKGDVLYCKQDYLFYLQSCVYSEFKLSDTDKKSKYAELIEYMKKHEERLSGCYEFIKYDHETFENIKKLFFMAAAYPETLQVMTADGLVTLERVGPSPGVVNVKKNYIKVFDDLISKYPCHFLPNSKTKDKNATAVVRVFINSSDCLSSPNFVMESELYAAINLKNPDRKPLECMDTDGRYRIVDYKRVLESYRDQIGDIDFIYHAIDICPHRAVPIVTPTGDHCIQPFDAFLDIFTEAHLVLQVFQNLSRDAYHTFIKFIAIFEKYIPPNIKYRYLINLKVVQQIQKELEELWKPIEDESLKKAQNFRPNRLKEVEMGKELNRLGYTKILIEFKYRHKVCTHARQGPCEYCSKGFKDAEARMEKETEKASMSSTVTDTTLAIKEDGNPKNPEDIKNSKESTPKPETSEGHETSEFKNEKPVEISEPNPVLPDSNTHHCEKCMETSNAAKEKINETHQKMMILEKTLKENDAELERLRVFEQKSKKLDETEKKLKDLEKNSVKLKILESDLEEKREKLSTIKSELEEKAQRCEELEKAIKEKDDEIYELSEAKKAENQEKEDFKATVNKLLQQLKDKDKENNKLKQANSKLEKSRLEKLKKHNDSLLELETKIQHGLEQLKERNSRIKELELKNSKITEEKNVEIEKLKKQQESMVKENKKEIEQMKRNVWKSTSEIKKMAAKISEKEAAENHLKRSNNELIEKFRKSDSNLQEIFKTKNHLETEIADKTRIIQELQKSAEKHVSEQEKAKKEFETLVSTFRGILDKVSPLEAPEKLECLICFYEIKNDQKTLKCEHCLKIVHFECASKWLQIHRSCAHCRREQLDPNEFPNLH